MFRSVYLLLLLLALLSCTACAPYDSTSTKFKRLNRDAKKDIFVSRGWGAGGMPFNVLYMNPTFSSIRAQATAEPNMEIDEPVAQPYLNLIEKNFHHEVPRVRNPMRNNPMRQRMYNRNMSPSVIPQLFVSYGWGPLGRK